MPRRLESPSSNPWMLPNWIIGEGSLHTEIVGVGEVKQSHAFLTWSISMPHSYQIENVRRLNIGM
eukprot:scaffold45252_cov24-Cyclotella_meneghiniana.AAC.1